VHAVTGDTWSGSVCPSLAVPEGPGVYYFKNTRLCVSCSIDGVKLKGPGRMTWADSSRYEAEFSDSTLHGKGEYVWPSGDVYRGECRAGKRHGTGTYVSTNPEMVRDGALKALGLPSARCMRYHGEWEANIMCGREV